MDATKRIKDILHRLTNVSQRINDRVDEVESKISSVETANPKVIERNIGHTTHGDNSPIFGSITVNSSSEYETACLRVSYLERLLQDKEMIISLLKNRSSY